MNEKAGRDKTGKIKDWVQTVAVILATIWGVNTFMYKEWYLPKTALVNISTDLSLRRIGLSDAAKPPGPRFVAVELAVSATNPSTREVFLLPNIWVARGFRLKSLDNTQHDFLSQFGSAFKDARLGVKQRGVADTEGEPVALGRLFGDDRLKPNEKIMRKIVFHVLKDQYDYIEVRTTMPTVTKEGRLDLEWKYKDGRFNAIVFRNINDIRDKKELDKKVNGDYSDGGVELQFSTSQVALSLWQDQEHTHR